MMSLHGTTQKHCCLHALALCSEISRLSAEAVESTFNGSDTIDIVLCVGTKPVGVLRYLMELVRQTSEEVCVEVCLRV